MEPTMVAQDDHVSPRYLTYHGAVEYTSLSLRTLAELVAEGKLHPARVGRRVLLDVQELDQFLEDRKADPQEQTESQR
jgi:excisionase family DNA binding protein